MKKILVALLALALVAPAMANVAITATDAGSQQLLISFAADGGSVVRGVALTLTVTGATSSYMTSSFNTFVDYAFSNPTGYTVGAGHPLALETTAGVITTPVAAGTPFAVSVGYLDQAGAQAGLTSGTVVKLQLNGIPNGGSATVAISANATRGGAVVGDNLGTVTVQPSVTIAGPVVTEAVKSTAPFYAAWVSFGKPNCWAYRKNCKGDADGLYQSNKQGMWAVGTNDLNILLPAFQIMEPPAGAGVMTKVNGICADFDHAAQSNKQGQWRVGTADLNLLLANWQIMNPGVADCDNANYNFWTN